MDPLAMLSVGESVAVEVTASPFPATEGDQSELSMKAEPVVAEFTTLVQPVLLLVKSSEKTTVSPVLITGRMACAQLHAKNENKTHNEERRRKRRFDVFMIRIGMGDGCGRMV
jgi:hypothetical protein